MARVGTERIGLFGGSFNPPHVCHLLASIYLLETGDFDQVWWLPVHVHAFAKRTELVPWEHRLAMCEAVTADRPGLRVDPVEADLGPRSYTIDTVTELQRRHPDRDFGWIIGSDLLPELPRWHRWDDLRRRVTFYVVGRGEDSIELPEGGRFVVREMWLPDISSTSIREQLGRGELAAVRPSLPKAVAEYLAEHPGLYGG